MLRMAKTGKVSEVLAGLLLALTVLFTGGRAQAATKPAFDLQAPLGGEVFAPGQEILIRVAPQGSVINMSVDLDIYDSTGTTLVNTVSLGSISNVKPTKFKLHQTPFNLPLTATGLPSSHCRIRLGTITKLGLFESESGDFIIGSPGLLPNSVDTTHIIDDAIQSADIGDGQVTSADILDGGIATVDIADKAVTGAKLLNDATDDALRAVTTNHIKDVAVTNAKIANSAVDANKLATDAVTTAKILDSAVTTAKIADGNVTLAKLPTTTAGRIIIGQNAAPPSYIAMNGDATIDASGLLDLSNLAVETAEINDLAVTSAKLANDAVTTAKILDGQITTAKIGNSQIQNANIADGAVDTNKIQNGTIVAADLEAVFNASLHRQIDNKNVALVGNAGGTIFLTSTANSTSSGAFLVGTFDEFTNSSNTNVQGVLKDFDTALNTALVSQNLFSQVNVPSGDSVISANSPTTQLTLTSPVGSGITVTGNNTTKTITLDVAAKAFDGDDLADSVAGDGLFYSGSGPRVLNVGATVGGAITVNANDLGVSADGINGVHMASDIVADDITQTFTFPSATAPLMAFDYPNVGANIQIFRVAKTGSPSTTPLLTIDSDGDTSITGLLTASAHLNVATGFLTTGNIITPNFSVNAANGNTTIGGTLTVTGGLAATSLASDGDFVLDIDKNNDGGSANFTVKNNNSTETVFNVQVTDSTSVVATLGFTNEPGSLVFRDGAGRTGTLALIGALGANRTYSFPDKSGTVAMLSDIGAPIAAPTVTSSTLRSNGTTWVENTNFSANGNGGLTVGNGTGPNPGTITLHDNDGANNNAGTLQVASTLTGNRTYTFPDANGTVALTNSGALTLGNGTAAPLQGSVILHDNNNADTNSGTIVSAATYTGNRTYTLPDASGTFLLASGGALTLGTDTALGGGSLVLEDDTNNNTFQGTLKVTNPLTADRTYSLPDADGTLARLADITATNLSGTVPVSKGGTGVDGTALTDGQLLIGNNGGDTFTVANLTGTANQVTVANGSGSITLSTPQDIGTASSPTFAGLTLGDDTTPTAGSLVFEDDQNGDGFQGTIKIITGGLTTDQTYSLPNTSGTLAVKADIDVVNLTGILSAAKGGTGADNNTPANGQLLVGNSGTGTYQKATLGSTNLTITPGAGALSIDTPQNVASTASPTFAGLTVGKTVLTGVSIVIATTSQDMSANSLLNLGDDGGGVGGTRTVTLTNTSVGQLIVVMNFDTNDNAIIQVGSGAGTVTAPFGQATMILVLGTDNLIQL